VSDVYISQEVRNAQPFNQSPSKSFGAHGLIREGCEALEVVVVGCGIGIGAGGVRAMFFDCLVFII
jgi:hypothetical protein